jgi:hypothetical protein
MKKTLLIAGFSFFCFCHLNAADTAAPSEAPRKESSFFKIPIKEKKVVFIIDVSGSMRLGAKIGNDYSKIVKEVKQCLDHFQADTEFDIIAFGIVAYLYKPTLIPVPPEFDNSATGWLSYMNPENKERKAPDFGYVRKGKFVPNGSSRADLAFEAALELKPEVILFLTDGTPTVEGGPEGLINKIKELQDHNSAPATIHSIFFKTSQSAHNTADNAWLRKLSAQNKGLAIER